MSNKAFGVIIGRFQIDNLHDGHMKLIDHVVGIHGRFKTVILVGDRGCPPSDANPLSFELRKEMLLDYIPDAIILKLDDCRTNEEWSMKLDTLLDAVTDGDAVLYSGRDSFVPHYKGKYSVEVVDLGCDAVCARDRRKNIGETPEQNSALFRRGIIYSQQNAWHRTHETVDIALLWNQGNGVVSILLGQKHNETEWRLPGGFVNGDETFSQAAGRELMEETGATSEDSFKVLDDYIISDWRVRDAGNASHRTVLVVGWYSFGRVKAADDLAQVKWFDVKFVMNDLSIVVEHRKLLTRVQEYVNSLQPIHANH